MRRSLEVVLWKEFSPVAVFWPAQNSPYFPRTYANISYLFVGFRFPTRSGRTTLRHQLLAAKLHKKYQLLRIPLEVFRPKRRRPCERGTTWGEREQPTSPSWYIAVIGRGYYCVFGVQLLPHWVLAATQWSQVYSTYYMVGYMYVCMPCHAMRVLVSTRCKGYGGHVLAWPVSSAPCHVSVGAVAWRHFGQGWSLGRNLEAKLQGWKTRHRFPKIHVDSCKQHWVTHCSSV